MARTETVMAKYNALMQGARERIAALGPEPKLPKRGFREYLHPDWPAWDAEMIAIGRALYAALWDAAKAGDVGCRAFVLETIDLRPWSFVADDDIEAPQITEAAVAKYASQIDARWTRIACREIAA